MKIKINFVIDSEKNKKLDHLVAEQKINGYNRSRLLERALDLLFWEMSEKKATVKKEVIIN